ncbi:MAG: hypothetical protein PHN42_03170 [Bacilli bacterium]|nr:hypothetical protein [Bacilli bacterium]
MIENLEKEQQIVCKILKNAVLKQKIGHAYLFETNGYKDKIQLAKEFAKMILCPKNNEIKHCGKCTQCDNIDKNIFSELKIISPEGLWIKKEQLDDLQKEFSTTGIQSNKRVYIIDQADRLNKQSANSILKFLEEPQDNIIAILICDNVYQMMNTISSRCQIISFKRQINNVGNNIIDIIKNSINVNVNDERFFEIMEVAFNFILYYENNKKDALLKTQKLWHNLLKEKDEILLAINIIILIYKDIINYNVKGNFEYFNDYKNELIKLADVNNIEETNKKIKVIINTKEKINYNINSYLLIDKLILDLERCD